MTRITTKAAGDRITSADMTAVINKMQTTNATSVDWETAFPRVFSIRNYGATGASATLDTSGLQAAIDAINPARTSKDIVYVPMGTFTVRTTVRLRSNMTLWIDGKLKQAKSTAPLNMLALTSGSHVSIIGGVLDGDKANQGDNTAGGLLVIGTTASVASHVNIIGTEIVNGAFDGFVPWNSRHVYLSNCLMQDCFSAGADPQTSASHIFFSNCRIQGGQFGLVCDSGSRYVSVIGGSISVGNIAAGGAAVHLLTCSDITVQNAKIDAQARGAVDVVNANRVSILDNDIDNVTGYGVQLDQPGSDIIVSRNRFKAITGNVIDIYGGTSIKVRDNLISDVAAAQIGIQGNTAFRNITDLEVTGNTIKAPSGGGAIQFNSAANVGSGRCYDNEIPSAQTISPAAAWTVAIRRNTRYVTENGGNSSVSDGTTVSHGLATTPKRVILTSQSALPRIMAVTAIGATNFTIAVKSTTGTAVSNTRAYWYAEV